MSKVTNINNINNNNYTNNFNYDNYDNYINDCASSKDDEMATITWAEPSSPAALSGLASLPSGSSSGDSVDNLPRSWRGLKLDLFENSPDKFKLKVGIIKPDGTTQSLVANLNSPKHYIWRGVPDEDRSNFHWRVVKNTMDELKGMSYRISKLTLPNNTNRTQLVSLLSKTHTGTWWIRLILDGQCWDYEIDKDCHLTKQQQEMKCVATRFIGRQQPKLLSVKDLGL